MGVGYSPLYINFWFHVVVTSVLHHTRMVHTVCVYVYVVQPFLRINIIIYQYCTTSELKYTYR